MVQESTRCAYENCTTFPQSRLLFLGIFTAHNCGWHDKAEGFQQFLKFELDLNAQLPRWTEDDTVGALVSPDLFLVNGVLI